MAVTSLYLEGLQTMTDKLEVSEAVDKGGSVAATKPSKEPPAFRRIGDVLALETGDAIFHNFIGDKMSQYRLTAIATGGACLGFDEMPEGGIDLQFWFCHRVEMVSQTGEIITPVRTVLIDKKGQPYSFVSDGIAKELDTLRSLFGDGPYTDPMLIKVRKIKTRKGSPTYTMGPA